MTAVTVAPRRAPTGDAGATAPARDDRPDACRAAGRWVAAIGGALVIFGAFMVAQGRRTRSTAYADMFQSTFTSSDSIGEILIETAPILLAALAVTVPARAGLINVGGEGQLVIGGVAAAGVVARLGDGACPAR